MLIDASIHGPEAARALRRWRLGIGIGLLASLLSSLVVWSLWHSDTFEMGDSVGSLFLLASGVSLVSAGIVFFGVRDYVGAIQGSFGALPQFLLVAAGIEVAVSGFWFASQTIQHVSSIELLSSDGVAGSFLRFVSVVAPLATVAAVMAFGRVTSTLGARLSPMLAGAIVSIVVGRLGLRVLHELELGNLGGRWTHTGLHWVGELLFLALLTAHARTLAAHRPLVPGGVTFGSSNRTSDEALGAPEWEAPGRALARYRNAIVAQMLLSLLSALIVLATRETPEAIGKVISGAAILGLLVSLFLVVSIARYATSLPSLHASGPAKLGVALFVLNAIVGLVTTVLVVRAFSSGRLGLLFDLQDMLPVLEAVGTLCGLGGLLALLYSFDALGHELGERALPVRTRGLKISLVLVVIFALLAKLGAGFFGPLVAVFALAFALGALFTVFSYLRVVGDVSALLLARAGVL